MTSISRDEWLSALGAAVQPCDPDALTVAEISQQFGVGRTLALKRARQLVAEGRAIQTMKMTSRGRATAYKLVKAPKGKR